MKQTKKIQKNKLAQELGKLGGQATRKKYGKKHFSEIGKKGMVERWKEKKKQE